MGYSYADGQYRDNLTYGVASYGEVYNNYIIPNSYAVPNPQKFWKDYQKAYTSAMFGISNYNALLTAGQGGGLNDGPGWDAIKLLWNLKIIGGSVPDNISFDLTLGTVFGIGESETFSINILTRGDAGFYLTRTEQSRIGAEVDWGLNVNFGYFTGDPLDISKSTLLGPIRSASFGFYDSGNLSLGYRDKSYGFPSWITGGTGIGLTGGVSVGNGKTYGSWTGY